MIRGRDVKLDDINNYLKEVKRCTEDGVILMSKHPSTMLTGHYTPRYKTNGAIMVVFEKEDRILIDYVGPGFDVGDITRGKQFILQYKYLGILFMKSLHIIIKMPKWYGKDYSK